MASLATVPAHALPEQHGVFNNPSCQLTEEHPYPIVFLHGTAASSKDWEAAGQAVAEQGMCPWTIDYGRNGVTIMALGPIGGYGDVDASTREIAHEIDDILAATGAEKVSLVGHSQGGTHTKKYIQQLGNADKVDRVVTLAATFDGTTLNGAAGFLSILIRIAPRTANFFASKGSTQQLVGTPQVGELQRYPDTAPGIMYTGVYSPSDTTATPNETSIIDAGPGADVVNVNIEEACTAGRPVTHPEMPYDDASVDLITWGLTRAPGETMPVCGPTRLPTRL